MRRVVGILGVCLATSMVWGHLHAEAPETTPESKPETEVIAEEHASPQIAEEVRQRLHEPITLKLDRVPLEDALNEILRKRNIDFWFDNRRIADDSIRLDSVEVTCELKNVSIRGALKRILCDAGLSWMCEDSGIRITSATHQASSCFPRIYDVAVLLEKHEVEVTTTPAMPHQETRFEGKETEGPKGGEARNADALEGRGGGKLVVAVRPAAEKPTPESILIKMIQGATGGPPDAPWMEADGEGGSVHLIQTPHAKLLVIRQTELAHAEIENLLNELISHQHAGEDEGAEETPAEKTASRKIVRPKVRVVAQRGR